MVKQKKKEDGSAEEKIKSAARKLFTERGFDGVRTRDIAAEAGINLALLNYYFRSKEKLFDIIMIENFEQFIQQLLPVMGDDRLTLNERLTQIVTRYIDMLSANPDLPFFILREMRSGSSKLAEMREKMLNVRNTFVNQFDNKGEYKQAKPVHRAHLMMNFMGLILFPFIAQPMLMNVNKLNKKEFDELMEERKELIPVWLKAIMKTK